MAKKKTPPVKSVAIPETREEAAEFIRKIGEAQRRQTAIADRLTAKIEGLKATAVEEAQPLGEEIDDAVLGLYLYAESHRAELTNNEALKTVRLPTGEFAWRIAPHKVTFKSRMSLEDVSKELRKRGLNQFMIQPPAVPSKEKMLESAETRALAGSVPGITIGQDEYFTVKPAQEGVVAIETPTNKLRPAEKTKASA